MPLVKPDMVLEVAFNSIQPSTRHVSGLVLRFLRIKAIRCDKNVDSIDTLDTLGISHNNARICRDFDEARK